MNFNAALADVVLAIHCALVAFNVGGLVIIWIGFILRWSCVRNFAFRIAHLLSMGLVAVQTLAGLGCPLTVWENALRVRAGQPVRYEESCIEHWLGRVLFYEASGWVFTAVYTGFFLLIVLTYWKMPPRWPKRLSRGGAKPG